jgi:hypothetical protein
MLPEPPDWSQWNGAGRLRFPKQDVNGINYTVGENYVSNCWVRLDSSS